MSIPSIESPVIRLDSPAKATLSRHFVDLLQLRRTCIAKKLGQVFDKLSKKFVPHS